MIKHISYNTDIKVILSGSGGMKYFSAITNINLFMIKKNFINFLDG